jgi:hypothetical protein
LGSILSPKIMSHRQAKRKRRRVMNIDFSQVITDFDGKPFPFKDGENTKDLTLGRAAVTALSNILQGENDLPGEERFKRGKLAEKVFGKGTVALTTEEIVLIKRLIGKAFWPRAVSQAWDMLEGNVAAPPSAPGAPGS